MLQQGIYLILVLGLITSETGCKSAAPVSVEGIPNLRQVDAQQNVWRSGQFVEAEIPALMAMGISNVVKLNTEFYSEFTLWTQHRGNSMTLAPISLAEQVLGPTRKVIDAAVNAIGPGTLVHCEHGRDRTGLVVACWRVKVCGWTKQQAEDEMLTLGFRKSELGLWEFWKRFE